MWGFCRVKSCSGEIGRGSVERRVGRGKGVPRRAERGGLPPYLPLRPTPLRGGPERGGRRDRSARV